MMNKKATVRAGLVCVTAVSLFTGAFSYFTDYDFKELSAKAGTLTMDISKDTTDLSNGLEGIINPGDSNPLTFTVTNTGEKSMDVKAVLTVTAPQAFTEADHEFKITDTAGQELTGTLSTDKKVITYTIDDVALAGSIEDDTKLDGTETAHTFSYKFAMDEDADNTWQSIEGDVKIEVYAKQHRNTDGLGSDWVSIVEK